MCNKVINFKTVSKDKSCTEIDSVLLKKKKLGKTMVIGNTEYFGNTLNTMHTYI